MYLLSIPTSQLLLKGMDKKKISQDSLDALQRMDDDGIAPTNFDWLDDLQADEVMRLPDDTPEDQGVAQWVRDASMELPVEKEMISIRLDKDILTFFRGQGRGYQSRINAILRIYMKAQLRHK